MATASKYDTLADAILTGVGGESNVKSVTHCATRLRFQLNDNARIRRRHHPCASHYGCPRLTVQEPGDRVKPRPIVVAA